MGSLTTPNRHSPISPTYPFLAGRGSSGIYLGNYQFDHSTESFHKPPPHCSYLIPHCYRSSCLVFSKLSRTNMAGREQSSASIQPQWEDIGGGIHVTDEGTSSTFIRVIPEWHRQPSLGDLLEYGKAFFDYVDTHPRYRGVFSTQPRDGRPGSRLVATLSFAYEDLTGRTKFQVFQSTIPRGVWRAYMLENGERQAPLWWQEAIVKPPDLGSRRVALHAEDSAIFLCNNKFPDFNSFDIWPYMVVYGTAAGSALGEVPLCTTRSSKNSHCQEVARRMGILFTPNRPLVRNMDVAENLSGSGGLSYNHYTTEDELRDRRGPGGDYTASNNNFTQTGPSGFPRQVQGDSRTAGHGDLSGLTKDMSKLRVSGSSHRKSQSRSSAQSTRALPGSQARPPTTSSQARPSTKTSAPRTSAERLPPTSHSSDKHGRLMGTR
ncbi:uncharacterized protein B0T15DRAFT_544846 [Chaetomium strumarium]|uniref:Uncharacterized protein n=1 Tax=Chaetomium strumarium TaxID=1170767 RepID=A0AAJ0GKZ5_9PEZI|nr:hypothetical protein B0T15DRAFT_544846 [Chaetomium strumarium]